MTDLVRVGLIGVGNIGTSHARDLSAVVSGSEVTAVFDADRDRADQVAAQVGATVLPSAQAVFEADIVDAVVIASPDRFHAQQVLDGLATGKAILCEKPMTVAEADARAVVEAEVAVGRRRIQVGFMRRFDPGYIGLRTEIGSEGIGEPLIVHNIHRNTEAAYELATEQTLTAMVIHEFDIGRWLLDDEFEWVSVLTGRAGPRTPDGQHDPILVILRSRSGVLVEIEAFANARSGYEVICRVTGSEGQAVMGDGAFVTRSRAFNRGMELPELWLGRFAEAYRLQLQAWIDAVAGDRPPPGANAWDGYVATAVANRAIESYRGGRRVDVELPPRPALYH